MIYGNDDLIEDLDTKNPEDFMVEDELLNEKARTL